MSRRRGVAAWGGFGALVLSMLLLAACAGSGAAAGPAPTPNAATIAQRFQNSDIKDASFDMTLSTSQGGQTIDATGSGKLTRTPVRFSFKGNATVAGQQVEIDLITDDASKTTYTRIPLLSDKWTKAPSTSSDQFGSFDIKNAKLIGTETVNGTACFHLQGTDTTDGKTTTSDYWISQDKYYPVKLAANAADGSQATMTFTGVNTGTTIDLPSADQVASA